MKPFIVTLTGPSCAGKTTLESLLKNYGFSHVISTTTRPPRFGEEDGVNYHFVSHERFIALLENGEMIEHVRFDDSLYGITKEEIERIAATGKPVVIVVEPHGQEQVMKFCKQVGWECRSVFINGPERLLAKRFLHRVLYEIKSANHAALKSVMDRYASRLETMMTVERGWVAGAYFSHKTDQYDSVIHLFDTTTQPEVVSMIVNWWVESISIHKRKSLAA